MKGRYIVFEGIDGAGKSSLIKRCVSHFQNNAVPVISTAEPTNSPIGSMIRNILGGRLQMSEQTIAGLFLADRLDHLQNEVDGILQYIDRGITVLGDRYYLSSYAYHVPHVSLDWVIKANEVCANLLRPDITFYIDISVETSLERISKGRQTTDLFENRNRITTVKQNYEEAISAVTVKENIIRINGEQSEEAVFADILSYL